MDLIAGLKGTNHGHFVGLLREFGKGGAESNTGNRRSDFPDCASNAAGIGHFGIKRLRLWRSPPA